MPLSKRIRKNILPAFFTVVLLLTNVALGVILTHQAGKMLISLIQSRMLDISDTAAAMLDGDSLARLTADDTDSEEYVSVLQTLTYFRNNIDLKYIYCVAETDDGFAFTLDPTIDDPGEFGEPVVNTAALRTAATGVSAVDNEPYQDRWGTFYSAYSPVFTSDGKVGGIVAVDFSADWYDSQVTQLRTTVILFGAASLLIGIVSVILLTHRNRKRYRLLYGQLNQLAVKVDELMDEVGIGSFEPIEETAQGGGNDIDSLGTKIIAMQEELRGHIERAHQQAYLDTMTGVGNKTAYLNAVKLLEAPTQDGTADFSVAIFDMNGLKIINDNYGHECGDDAIIDTAKVLKKLFGSENLYRIGGDEFIAIMTQTDEARWAQLFASFDAQVAQLNSAARSYVVPLSLSKGCAIYDKERDADYKSVFKRADMAMYADKNAYYQAHGDRRKKNPYETEKHHEDH